MRLVYLSYTIDFKYKGLSLMRDDFSGPSVQNVRNFRQLYGTSGYKTLIDPVPSGPLHPKSTVGVNPN